MVMTKPGGTSSPICVIAQRLAPLPPSSILSRGFPSSNVQTYVGVVTGLPSWCALRHLPLRRPGGRMPYDRANGTAAVCGMSISGVAVAARARRSPAPRRAHRRLPQRARVDRDLPAPVRALAIGAGQVQHHGLAGEVVGLDQQRAREGDAHGDSGGSRR